MGYEIMSHGVDLTDQTRAQILTKVGKIDKYLTDVPEANYFLRIRLNRNTQNPRWVDALLDLSLPDAVLIGSDSANNPVHAVHLAVIHLERQLTERKERAKPYV
ncbi:MAG: ribosome hibernation-promoting factor, HPF/YfiA family [Anaerolineae bacterium]